MDRIHLNVEEQMQTVEMLECGDTQIAVTEAFNTSANVKNSCGTDTVSWVMWESNILDIQELQILDKNFLSTCKH